MQSDWLGGISLKTHLSASVVSLKSLVDQYNGAKAEEWRHQLNNLIQLVWSSTNQVTPLKKQRNNSLILFFVFLDSFERIRNGPWESMASPMSVSFMSTQAGFQIVARALIG